MSADRHERLGRLFDALVDLPSGAREEEALRLCPEDEELRRAALRLCAESEGASTSVLDAPPPGLEELLETEGPGDFIGPYRLIRRAGEGGFGVVYEAEQTEPIERRVAIKLVKPGMDSRQVLARFNAERQTLARLDHPCIARVLDAGTTPRGRPYFLMDFIDGAPITEHCDAGKFGIGARIGLFLQVCAAIEHAHQRGVIHRDIKPSNVLVAQAEEGPVVRVIDFGIARALDGDGPAMSRMTVEGQFVGTPAYMSPEQRSGDPASVDTRSDVYALGVLLYELLTGERPFGDEPGQREETATPSRPSTRFTTRGSDSSDAAAARGGAPEEVGRALRGELDWIVLRAIEHEPARRYASVGDLAADLRRHLQNEPVLARPPSRVYSARKFIARNRALVGAIGVSAAALLAASVIAAVFAVSESRQRRAVQAALEEAERERRIASVTSEFMTEGLIAAALPTELGRDVTMRDAARFAAERIDAFEGLQDAPEVEATVRVAIARTLRQLGEGDAALAVETPAYAIRRGLHGAEHPSTLEVRTGMGDSHSVQRRHREALDIFEEVHAILESAYGPEDGRTLHLLRRIGSMHIDLAEDDAAESALRRAVDGFQRLGPEYARDLYKARRSLQALYANMGESDLSRDLALETLEQARALFGEESLETAQALSMLASIAGDEGRHEDAVAHLTDAIEIRKSLLGPDHGSLTEDLANRAIDFFALERIDDAYRDAAEANRIAEAAYGVESFASVLSASNALYLGTLAGEFEAAERYGLTAYEHAPGTRVPRSHIATNLVSLYEAWERTHPGQGHGEKADAFRQAEPAAP